MLRGDRVELEALTVDRSERDAERVEVAFGDILVDIPDRNSKFLLRENYNMQLSHGASEGKKCAVKKTLICGTFPHNSITKEEGNEPLHFIVID